jgi:glycosyltransferase 2 family protein
MITSKQLKSLIVVIILSVVAYLFFSLWGGWHEVLNGIQKIGLNTSLIVCFFSLQNYFIRFIRWQFYLEILEGKVPWLKSLQIYFAGFALTTTPGKMGETLRCLFLKKYDFSYRKGLGAFFAERFSDLISILLLSMIGLWQYRPARTIVILTAVFVIAIIAFIQNKKWLQQFESFVNKTLPSRAKHIIDFCIDMILEFRKCYAPKQLLIALILGLIAWGAEGFGFYYMLQAFHPEIAFTNAIFIYSFSLLIGALTFLPGGLGSSEIVMSQLLISHGFSTADSVAATILIRVLTLWFSVLIGLLMIPLLKLEKESF